MTVVIPWVYFRYNGVIMKCVNGMHRITIKLTEKQFDQWEKHLHKFSRYYDNMSQLIRVNTEYGIEADNYKLNQAIGRVGTNKIKLREDGGG